MYYIWHSYESYSILTAMEKCTIYIVNICVYNELPGTNYTIKKGNDFPILARESLVSDI
jgi:hypothetical protein